jgi:hypothetical protein
MEPVFSWHLWPVERAWPALAADEAAFVAELRARSGKRSTAHAKRSDVTVVVTALRNGASVSEVLAWAPGLKPAPMLSGYLDLEERMRQSAASWHAIVDDPSMTTLAQQGVQAARLLPYAVSGLVRVARVTQGAGLALAAAKLVSRSQLTARRVAAAERQLGAENDRDKARELGLRLFHPGRECLWGEPLFVPERVGQLTPTRVADLMAPTARLDPLAI